MNVHLADPQTISKKFPNRGGGGGGGVGVGGVGATSLGQTSAAASAKRTSLHNLMNADGDQHHPYLSSPSPSSHHTTPATSSANTPTTTGNANANNNNNNNPLVRSSSNNPISISGLLNNPNPTLLPPPPPPPPASSSSSSSQQQQQQQQQQQHYRSSHQQYTQQPLAPPPPPPPQAHSASSLSPAPPSISAPPPTTTTTTTNKPASSRTTATISSAAAANSAASGSLTVPVKSTSSKPRSTKARASASTASTAAAAAAASASASASANTSNANVATNSSIKSRSPSPFRLPPPPPPLQTIRLDISLGGPDKYEIDIAMLAKESGQRPPTPEPVKRYNSSDSEGEGPGAGGAGDGEDDEGEDGEGKKKKKKKRKRAAMSDYYDTTDPFIDDTELEIDHRTTFAQTKQQGFYVSSGEVALVKDKSRGKKPKRSLLGPHNDNHTGAPSSAAHPKTANKSKHDGPGPGSKDHPIDLSADDAGTSISTHRRRSGGGDDEDEEEDGEEDGEDAVNAISAGLVGLGGLAQDLVGEKRKRYTIVVTEEGKKRKVVDVTSFHPALQESMAQLRLAIRQEDWTQRGKFPQTLKPLLNNLALQSIKLDEYDEHFFNYMPELFPYNKFTMRKLIKRTVFPDHITLLVNRQDEILEDLKQEARAGFSKAEEEWEKSVVAWDKRQEKARAEAASASAVAPHSTSVDGTGGGGTGAGSDSNGPTRQGSEEMMDVDQPGEHVLMDGVDMNEYDPLSAAPPGSLSAYSMGASTATATATALGSGTAAGKASTRDQHPPAKRYRMTEGMKNKVWQLVLLSNECCRLENEKNTLEGSGSIVSEQGHRKQLYQRIVAAFPEGWMNSGQISREVSAMKKRFEKEAMDEEP